MPGKDKRGTLDVIPLMALVEVNHCQYILHMYKRMVHCYSADEIIDQISIGSMINPSLNCNRVFREQVEKCLSVSFHKNNTCVMAMALIMFDDNYGLKSKKCLEC